MSVADAADGGVVVASITKKLCGMEKHPVIDCTLIANH